MSEHFEKVKSYLLELNLKIVSEDPAEELVVIEAEDKGIKNLIIDCEDPILVIEQAIFKLTDAVKTNSNMLLRLLQMNRSLVHGAFVVDEEGAQVIFRDTLQLKNLDLNELEASINALSLGLAEFGSEILEYVKK